MTLFIVTSRSPALQRLLVSEDPDRAVQRGVSLPGFLDTHHSFTFQANPFHLADAPRWRPSADSSDRALGDHSRGARRRLFDPRRYLQLSIDATANDAANSLVAALAANVATRPRVVRRSNGTLQLEWHDGPKSPELEFESPTSIRYLTWFPEEGIEQEASIPAATAEVFAGLIPWFVNGTTE